MVFAVSVSPPQGLSLPHMQLPGFSLSASHAAGQTEGRGDGGEDGDDDVDDHLPGFFLVV